MSTHSQKATGVDGGSFYTFIHRGEQLAFLLFLLTLPLQARTVLFEPRPFEEWRAGFLYASDLAFAFVVLFWIAARLWKSDFHKGTESAVEVRLPQKLFAKPFILLGLFLCVLAGALFSGDNSEAHSWYRLVKIGEGALLFVYAAVRLRDTLSFRAIAWAMVASGVLQSILGFLQFARQHSLGLAPLDEPYLELGAQGVAHIWADGFRMIRAYGTMPNPNVLAGFLAVILFFVFALFFYECQRARGAPGIFTHRGTGHPYATILLIAQFIILGGLFLTFSRGVLILFFVISWISSIFLDFIIFRTKDKNPYLLPTIYYLLVFYLLSSIFYLLVLFPELTSRVASSFAPQDAALSERFLFNVIALDAITQHPVWGVGLGNFTSFFRDTLPHMRDQLYQPVHNIFLLIAAENGLPALFLFILFLASVIGSYIRSLLLQINRAPFYIRGCMLCVVSCMLLLAMYDHFFWTIQQTTLLFWLVLGVGEWYGNDMLLRGTDPRRDSH